MKAETAKKSGSKISREDPLNADWATEPIVCERGSPAHKLLGG
jgi:hypothetical protein